MTTSIFGAISSGGFNECKKTDLWMWKRVEKLEHKKYEYFVLKINKLMNVNINQWILCYYQIYNNINYGIEAWRNSVRIKNIIVSYLHLHLTSFKLKLYSRRQILLSNFHARKKDKLYVRVLIYIIIYIFLLHINLPYRRNRCICKIWMSTFTERANISISTLLYTYIHYIYIFYHCKFVEFFGFDVATGYSFIHSFVCLNWKRIYEYI